MNNEINKSATINSINKNGLRFNQLFYGGIVVGLIIVGVGILATKYKWAGIVESRVILCSGLGILLGTFGSTAIIKYRGFVIAGVAALGIALSYVMVDQAAKTMAAATKDATFGNISGDIQHNTIEVYSDKAYYGALGSKGKEYNFVVYGKIASPVIYLDITFRDDEGKALGSDPFVIESKHINNYVGTGQNIEWKYMKKEHVVIDKEGKVIGKIGKHGANYFSGFLKHFKAWVLPIPAFAETQRSLKDIFNDLTSESALVRRGAGSELAARGPSALEPMMEEFREHQNIYRIRLGVLEALKEMLNKKEWIPEIREKLKDDDRRLLVECLTDNDLTIRVNAAMILFDLSDPRIIKSVLDSAKKIGIDKSDWLYLHVFAIKGSFYRLPESEKRLTLKVLIEEIRPKSGEKTQALIDSFHP